MSGNLGGSPSASPLFEPRFEFHSFSLGSSKPQSQVLSKPDVFSIGFTMENPRRKRFIAWFERTYPQDGSGRAKFMRDSAKLGHPPLTKGRVSQLFDAEQPFGERAARALAERFGLASDFFESSGPLSDSQPDLTVHHEGRDVFGVECKTVRPGAIASQLAASLARLPPARRKAVASLVAGLIESGPTPEEVNAIDALAPDVSLPAGKPEPSWRDEAMRLAEMAPEVERAQLVGFVQRVNLFISQKRDKKDAMQGEKHTNSDSTLQGSW